jgi:diaminohydroxyphosphoribosylaminopyrimidine deaminase/5-amino-6-(5-phosphoribosylamino)uracil reductase
LELAQNGAGAVAPNPMVGSVVVHDGKIIGEGFHQKVGEAHAEVNAIHAVHNGSLLPDSTIYVSLEPCAHFGKTPPCADLIVAKKIKRVVIGCLDPFAKVNGAGVKRLTESGAEVRVGILEKEAMELNRRFMTFHQKKRPYIILKWAETADGSVDHIRSDSNQKPLSITCNTANILVHKWRAEEAAIMVGKNTAILDDPSLTTRHYRGKNPIRILLDSNSETPASAKIFNTDAETIVINENTNDLQLQLAELHSRDVQSVMVEGGPTLHRSFYEAGLWDEIRRFVSPIRIAEGIKAMRVQQEPEQISAVGTDQLYTYRNR